MTEESGRGAAKRDVTRADVARYAGVSTAVVSYTLNNGPKPVAPATAARVLEAVRVLGYRPNAAARTLKRGSADMIGLIVPDNSNPFFAELAHAIEDAAAARGRALVVVNAGAEGEIVRDVDSLASRQVDGVIIGSDLGLSELAAVTASGIRVAFMSQLTPIDGSYTIGSDLAAGAAEGVRHLLWHGHAEIAFIGKTGSADARMQGWQSALRQSGLAEGPVFAAPYTREGGYRAGQELLAASSTAEHRPSAVFVSSDMQAIGVLRAFHEAGVRVPEDIAVVSFDGSPESEYSWPALTTLRQPTREMAVDAVACLLDDAPPAPEHRVYPVSLVIRQSCGCPLTP